VSSVAVDSGVSPPKSVSSPTSVSSSSKSSHDAVAYRQLHPGGDDAGRDLQVDVVVGDAVMVPCRPDVVCTRSPIFSELCRSMVACIAFFWRRDAKNMIRAQNDEQGQEDDQIHGNTVFRVGLVVRRPDCRSGPRR